MRRLLVTIVALHTLQTEAGQSLRWLGLGDTQSAAQVDSARLHPVGQLAAAATQIAPALQQMDGELSLDDGGDAKAGQTAPLIKKLEVILAELKERRDHIHHLENTVTQEKTMLEESRQMHSLASTKKGKMTFDRQVKNSERIFQDTTNMLKDSRDEATAASQALLIEMSQAKRLIQKIQYEAKALQKDLDPTNAVNNARHSASAKSKKSEDDDEEEADDDDEA